MKEGNSHEEALSQESSPWGARRRARVVLITLMTAALVVLIWGVASERLVEIFNRAMDSIAGI